MCIRDSPCSVEYEGDALAVQSDVHQHLVEGPVEERGVHGEDGVEPPGGEPGGRSDRMLLSDADVEDAIGIALGEPVQPGGVQHRRRDRHDPLVGGSDPEHFLAEGVRPGADARLGQRLAGDLVDPADRVEAVLFVLLRGAETAPLLGCLLYTSRCV